VEAAIKTTLGSRVENWAVYVKGNQSNSLWKVRAHVVDDLKKQGPIVRRLHDEDCSPDGIARCLAEVLQEFLGGEG
jgi:hypothetical protein